METTQWTGKETQRLSFAVVSHAGWFNDGHRLLVFAHQKAYQQPFPRGLYVIDTQDSTTTGPLVKFFQATRLGNSDRYTVGRKYLADQSAPSGNFARYNLADGTWHWITNFQKDSLGRGLLSKPVPNPTANLVVQPRRVDYAEQLFLFRPDADGKDDDARQITELGGDIPGWSPDGNTIFFRRDVNRDQGARYVPYRFDMETMKAEPLWPALPDSVPDFPPLSSQTLSKTLNRR